VCCRLAACPLGARHLGARLLVALALAAFLAAGAVAEAAGAGAAGTAEAGAAWTAGAGAPEVAGTAGAAAGDPAGHIDATQPPPRPFTAVYALEWHGLTAGYSTLSLSEPSPGTYVYSSVNRARGVFKLAFPDPISERSAFRIVDGRVEPLRYQEDDGPSRHNENVTLDFDWKSNQVHGNAGDKIVDQPLAPGTQDPLSVQVALMRRLTEGQSPTHFLLFDKTEAAEYRYTREGEVALDTAIGRLETVVYRSDRPDSDRVMRLWLAPSLGYLPVRAERKRGGKTEFELKIRSLTPPPDVIVEHDPAQ